MVISQKLSPIWNVPYQRNTFFTERDNTLQMLRQELQIRDAVALSQPQAITGLGGIGKTQMALEYAYRYGAKYAAVLWVRADSSASLVSSFVELAWVLNLPERNEQDQNVVVEAVQRWLRLRTDWLLIFDNMDNPVIATPFLPKAGPGHLLFTTRAQALSDIAQCMEVQPMRPEVGALLLLRRAEMISLQAALEQAAPDKRVVASEISNEMDGLPLALDQAGAYIKAEGCSLQDYLSLYRTRRQNLLQNRKNFDQPYPYSVATTWDISFDKVQRASPAAAELLNFCAFLAPDVIPETIIIEGAPYLGSVLAPAITGPIELDQICKEVLKYSLFQREGDAGTLTIHRLVQAVLQDNLSSEAQVCWKEQTVQAVDKACPNVKDVKQWQDCELWLPHALVCATWIKQEQFHSEESADTLNNAGYYLIDRGRYKEAESLHQDALTIREQQMGPEHPSVAQSLNNLAAACKSQGKYTEAELFYQRALTINEQLLGTEHFSTATCLNNLAELYQEQGKYTEAELLYRRALAINEQHWGPEHSATAISLNNLACTELYLGKHAEAKLLCQRALAIREQVLEPEHPHMATSLNNLATVCKSQGDYSQAKLFYQHALAINEQLLGPEHSEIATNLNNLALLYQEQGKYAEAEPLYQRALSINEQQIGLEHPHIAQSLGNLAVLYRMQGKYKEAEPMLKRAIEIYEQELGVMHPDVAKCLNNLAVLYLAQWKCEGVEPLLKRALAINEQELGVMHSEVAKCLNNLAVLYRMQSKHEEAELILMRALLICEQELGTMHPDTALSLYNLSLVYFSQGKFKEAKPLLRRALSIYEHVWGRGHPTTRTARSSYAFLVLIQKTGHIVRIGQEIRKKALDFFDWR
jgi:tetratricopeptide (TPR) repeat protein